MKPLIYIAAPYSHPDPVENTQKAMRLGMALYDSGFAAVEIPHLTMFLHLADARPYEHWMQFDKDKMEHCNAVWRMRGESPGADAEVEYALYDLQIPVFSAEGNEWDKMIEFCREFAS